MIRVMKGLREYIKKHGKHFTEKLVMDIMPIRWKADDIVSTAQKKVYYNVTGSTVGDMVYLVNAYHHRGHSKNQCILFMLDNIGNYTNSGRAFSSWAFARRSRKPGFDFTPYI